MDDQVQGSNLRPFGPRAERSTTELTYHLPEKNLYLFKILAKKG